MMFEMATELVIKNLEIIRDRLACECQFRFSRAWMKMSTEQKLINDRKEEELVALDEAIISFKEKKRQEK